MPTIKQTIPPKLTVNNNSNFMRQNGSSSMEPEPPRKSGYKRALKWFLVLIIVAVIGVGGFVAARAFNLTNKIFVGQNTDIYHRVTDIIGGQTGNANLIGQKDGQINVLLIGIGGAGHDGAYLSDTMILVQYRPGDKKASMISIPRDYLVNTKEFGQRKINAVFAETYDKTKDWNDAGNATIDVIEKMSGLQIPYFAVMDFKGFEKTVDLLGGVTVNIDRTFTDYTYPDNGVGYLPAVTFKEGTETMNGKRALIFARSRHAAGIEGTDFARSARQQKIIAAAKDKLVSLNLVSDSGKINELFTIIGDHFHTNMTPGELLSLYNQGKEMNSDSVISMSLDPASNIICPETLESNGAYVLTLCDGKTSSDLQTYFKTSFTAGAIDTEKAVVWLADSSTTGKLYKKAESDLRNAGLTVNKVIYGGKPLTQTVVYSVNNKPSTIDFIKSKLSASPVSLPPPGVKIDATKVDIIVILGSETASSSSNNNSNVNK